MKLSALTVQPIRHVFCALALTVVVGAFPSGVANRASAETSGGADVATPQVQIDAGGHTAAIFGLAFTSDNFLLSGGQDKVARVWDVPNGRTIKWLRGQISAGGEGKISTVAISKDDRIAAVAGIMGPDDPADATDVCGGPGCGDIRLFDLDTREVIGHLSGHTDTIKHIAVSPDGNRLASAGAGKDKTIRIWDLASRQEITGLRYAVPEIRASQLAFMPDGRHLAFASGANVNGGLDRIRVLDISGAVPRLVATLQGQGILNHVTVDDTGKLIAAAGLSGNIYVWPWQEPATEPIILPSVSNGSAITGLAFGRRQSAPLLIATQAKKPYGGVIWDVDQGAIVGEFPGHDGPVTALAVSPDGTRVATAGGTDLSILVRPLRVSGGAGNRRGITKNERRLGGAGRVIQSVGFIREGIDGDPGTVAGERDAIAWGYTDPCPVVDSCPAARRRLEHVMAIPGQTGGPLEQSPQVWPRVLDSDRQPLPSVERHAEITSSTHNLERSKTTRTKPFNDLLILKGAGATVELLPRGSNRGGDHTAYTFDPTGGKIASAGRNGALDLIIRDQNGIWRSKPLVGHTADVWSVAFDSTGRLLVSGSTDQTVRLWNATSGELLVTLFATPDDAWVMWTPQGYFAASPAGEKLVGWQFNQGRDRSAKFLTADAARAVLFRPRIVERAITLGSAKAAAEEARKADGTKATAGLDVTSLQTSDLPQFSIRSPKADARTTDKRVRIEVALPAAAPQQSTYEIYVNNVKQEMAKLNRRPFQDGDLRGYSLDVPLVGGENLVTVIGLNGLLRTERSVTVHRDGVGAIEQRKTLYVVAIGINHYPNLAPCFPDGTCELRQAVNDAETFIKTVTEHMVGPGKGHDAIEAKLVVGPRPSDPPPAGKHEKATRTSIRDALQLFAKATENDTVMLFVAGHGALDSGGSYYFLPSEAEYASDQTMKGSTVVTWSTLADAVANANGLRFMFVDTCRSQAAYNPELVNNASTAKVEVFTSAGSLQAAVEDDAISQGYFTDAWKRGLQGGADPEPKQRKVLVNDLGHFIEREVSRATRGQQVPHHPRSIVDFVLSVY
jgi:WD40 repeat protein